MATPDPALPEAGAGASSGAAPAPAAAPAIGSLLESAQALWRELPGLVSDRVELLSLELHRAGLALVQIIILILALAILGVTAWLMLWAGIVAALVALGLHMALALLAVLAINAVAAWMVVARVRKLFLLLRLPATRRHLMLSPSPQPSGPAPDTEFHERAPSPAAAQPVAL